MKSRTESTTSGSPHPFMAFLVLRAAASIGTGHATQPLVVPTDFKTIQAAVDFAAPGAIIRVLPGTYVEQVTIGKNLKLEGAGAESTTIQAPTPLVPFERSAFGVPRVAIVRITDGANVTMSGVTVSGPLPDICKPGSRKFAFGFTVVNGASLRLTNAHITHISPRYQGRLNGAPGYDAAAGIDAEQQEWI